MGNIKGKVFGLVVSKNVTDSLADSVKEGNQAKFYLAQKDGKALDDVTATTDNDRNTLIINGNRIQGVSNNDISKLDAITDATKLFTYKGSVDTFNDLPTGALRDVSVGDVWNIKSNFTLEGVEYPAYTNIVCVTATYGSQPVIKWDALGGTMQIGTYSLGETINNNSGLRFKTSSNIPISSFAIYANTNSGLYFNNENKLDLSVKEASPDNENLYNIHYITDQGEPMKGFNLELSSGLIYSNSLKVLLGSGLVYSDYEKASRAISINVATGLSIYDDNKLTINVGSGLDIGYNPIDFNYNHVYLSLSTTDYNSEYTGNHGFEVSGLTYDTSGRLKLAIATNENVYGDVIRDLLMTTAYRDNTDGSNGGLFISSSRLVSFITANDSIRDYIENIINTKLKAQ